jgi:hypothetical protein
MEFTQFTGLAAELRVATLEEGIADATLEEVMAMSTVCREWHEEVRRMLPGWLSKHAAGSQIGYFSGTKEQIQFVMEHIDGKSLNGMYIKYSVER